MCLQAMVLSKVLSGYSSVNSMVFSSSAFTPTSAQLRPSAPVQYASAFLMAYQLPAAGEPFSGSRISSMVYSKSAAVRGVPSE